MTQSVRTAFDREYEHIRKDLFFMSELVGMSIERSVQALSERDTVLAEIVIAEDTIINDLRFKIEEACLVLIATQQPAARDLRSVIAASHVAVELERMGDHAAGMAKTVIMMEEEPLLKTLKKIPKMGLLSRKMLTDSMQAFEKDDAAWATEIAARDDEIDRLYQAVYNRLMKIMAHKPEMVTRATYLMWFAHDLERIADRVTNICERVIFLATGEFQEINIRRMHVESGDTEPLDD